MLHAIAVIPITTAPIIAVFAFQLAGCPYHPPAGDQTCFGYLKRKPTRAQWISKKPLDQQSSRITYGIFPPLECETEAPLDSTDLIEWSFSIARGDCYFIHRRRGADAVESLGIEKLIDKSILLAREI